MSDERRIETASNLSESLESLSETYDLFILFIDLCESTRIKQYCLENDLPDSLWISRQMIFLSRTAKIIQKYSGTLVKTIGDEVMATFGVNIPPYRIIKCSIEIFQTFGNLKSYNKGVFKIFSKAAIDFGTCYDGQLVNNKIIDPIGSCVDRCSRISRFAGKNEIAISDEFMRLLDSGSRDHHELHFERVQNNLEGLGETVFYKTHI